MAPPARPHASPAPAWLARTASNQGNEVRAGCEPDGARHGTRGRLRVRRPCYARPALRTRLPERPQWWRGSTGPAVAQQWRPARAGAVEVQRGCIVYPWIDNTCLVVCPCRVVHAVFLTVHGAPRWGFQAVLGDVAGLVVSTGMCQGDVPGSTCISHQGGKV